jgi:hypothetical protein
MTQKEKEAALSELDIKIAELEKQRNVLQVQEVTLPLVWQPPLANSNLKYSWIFHHTNCEIVQSCSYYVKAVVKGIAFNHKWQAEQFALKCAADAAIAAAIELQHQKEGVVLDWTDGSQKKYKVLYDHYCKVVCTDWCTALQCTPAQFYYVGVRNMIVMLKEHGITEDQMKYHCGIFEI